MGRSVNGGCGEPRLLPARSGELEVPTGQLGQRRGAGGPVHCRREVGDPGAQTPPSSTVPCGGRGVWERLAAGPRSEDGRASLARLLRPQSKAQVAGHVRVTAHGVSQSGLPAAGHVGGDGLYPLGQETTGP